MQRISNYINGALQSPIKSLYLDNYNPATGAVYSLIPDSDEADVDLAYTHASEAYKTWRLTSLEERFMVINRIA